VLKNILRARYSSTGRTLIDVKSLIYIRCFYPRTFATTISEDEKIQAEDIRGALKANKQGG